MTKWLALLLFSVTAYAQQNNVSQIPDCSLGYCAGNGVPSFACFAGQKYTRVDTPGNNYSCSGYPPHWVPDAGNGGNILSVFGRTGAVAAQTGDYTASQVTNAADLSAGSNIFTGTLQGTTLTGTTGLKVGSGANAYSLLAPGGGVLEIVNPANTIAIATLGIGSTVNNNLEGISPTFKSSQYVEEIGASGSPVAEGSQKIETDSANFYDPANSYEMQLNVAGSSGTVTGHVGEGDVTTLIKNTNIKLQGASSVNGQLICEADGTNCPTSGSGVAYPSATNNAVPAASVSGGVTTLVDTAFSDNGLATFDAETLNLVGEYQQPVGTANSSNNFVSNVTNWLISYWNGTTAVQASWNVYAWVAQGASPPASVLTYYAPANLPVTAVLYAIDPGLVATSGVNYASPKFKVRGNTWNGTTGILDDWNWQGIYGTGANPTTTLQFTHSGTSGAAIVEMPGLLLDGAPLIGSGTASNSDISGELSFSSATTASYTFANSYTSHPECVFDPQFSTTVAHWVTYTGTTSFTINFASAVTGSASYICISRN